MEPRKLGLFRYNEFTGEKDERLVILGFDDVYVETHLIEGEMTNAKGDYIANLGYELARLSVLLREALGQYLSDSKRADITKWYELLDETLVRIGLNLDQMHAFANEVLDAEFDIWPNNPDRIDSAVAAAEYFIQLEPTN